MNGQGLGDGAKRRDVNFLERKTENNDNNSICMLQDTHFITKVEKYICSIGAMTLIL